MSTMTIRLSAEKHERLKALARRRGMSLNKLIEELSTRALAEADSETRFLARAMRGDPQVGLSLLDKLDKHYRV